MTRPRLITCSEASDLTGVSRCTIRSWWEQNRLTIASTRPTMRFGHPTYLFRTSDILRLARNHARWKHARTVAAPPGFETSREASLRSGRPERSLEKMMRDGLLEGFTIPITDKTNRYFLKRAAVDAYIASRLDQTAQITAESCARPLIAANDELCLSARWELWNRKKRRMNLRNVLAAARKAG